MKLMSNKILILEGLRCSIDGFQGTILSLFIPHHSLRDCLAGNPFRSSSALWEIGHQPHNEGMWRVQEKIERCFFSSATHKAKATPLAYCEARHVRLAYISHISRKNRVITRHPKCSCLSPWSCCAIIVLSAGNACPK